MPMNTLFMVLHIIVTVLLIAVVLLQEGKDPGLKGIAGSTPDGDSFFNRNSGRTKASVFSKMTTTLAILFLITTIVLCILNA
ncbi:MAG: preprotein translocase subunit SecG [Clostridia bacterium]|nr:preprotein translocase subunit SecG [Clostridia bacterium]